MLTDNIFKTSHEGTVIDVVASEKGNILASAGEDGLVCVYALVRRAAENVTDASDCEEEEWRKVTDVRVSPSAGVINSISWAPQKYYDAAFTVCTNDDKTVRIYSDFSQTGLFEIVYENQLPAAGWTCAWAPFEYGKLFVVGCADGSVHIFTCHGQEWETYSFAAHKGGICSLTFSPFLPPDSLLTRPLETEQGQPLSIAPPRLFTCGGSRHLKVWRHSFVPTDSGDGPPLSTWTPIELNCPFPATWKEVSWAPSVGLPCTYIAAGSEEGHVFVWVQDLPEQAEWRMVAVEQLPSAITRISWSHTGSFLLVSANDGTVVMFKETPTGSWERTIQITFPAF